MKSCNRCAYYDSGDAVITGFCRRFPPSIFRGVAVPGKFPIVAPDGWCGEYKGRDNDLH